MVSLCHLHREVFSADVAEEAMRLHDDALRREAARHGGYLSITEGDRWVVRYGALKRCMRV